MIVVVEGAALPKDELRRTLQEVLKISECRNSCSCDGRRYGGRVGEKYLVIENLWEQFMKVDAIPFAAEAKLVLASHPAENIAVGEVVLHLRVIARAGSNLKSGTVEGEFINGIGYRIRRACYA